MSVYEFEADLELAANLLYSAELSQSPGIQQELEAYLETEGPEYNDSAGQTLALADIHRFLLSLGLQPYPTSGRPTKLPPADNQILSNKQQVDARGMVVKPATSGAYPKLPDRSFIDPTSRKKNIRVNVEVDVNRNSFDASKKKLLGKDLKHPLDPNARHVFIEAHPDTGQFIRAEIYNPGRTKPQVVTNRSFLASDLLTRPKKNKNVIRARKAQRFMPEYEWQNYY